jgi:2-polyprenylphenol 6-hydroxylase
MQGAMMNQTYDVLIAGGGVVGLTAALAMADCGFTVALIDAGLLKVNPNPIDVRVYAINKASQALLDELQVWQHLDKKRLSPYHHMHVWDAKSGAAIDFDSRSIAAASLGAIIEESMLKQGLLAQIKHTPTIHLFADSALIKVEHLDNAIAVSSEKATWQGQLLMVAEGAHSPTREKLAVSLTSWSYQQQAIVATVHTEQSHQHTAYQVFHPQGPLAFLPLADVNQCSIVWSTDSKQAEHLMSLNEEDFNLALQTAFVNKLGRTQLVSGRHQFPLHMRHANHYVSSRWMLLGDAAHTIHPLAGLGLNVGLADVSVWYHQVKQDKKALTSTKALGFYQRERKSAVWQTILLMEGLKRLFSISLPPIPALRSLGLRFCNQLTPLKRLFIQHAAGE